MFVTHPLIKPESVEQRLYQENVLATAVSANTLVVLPTGLGKTAVAALLAAHRISKNGGKILVLAPTRPLVEQHKRSFAQIMEVAEGDMAVYTGKIGPKERREGYKNHVMIFATPQVVQNDLIAGRLDLSQYTLLVLDECHRGIGDYPYPFIAELYMRRAHAPRILGLTASPGATKEKVDAICKGLHIERVEIRTESDEDVLPYVQSVHTQWIGVDLPKEFIEVQVLLDEALKQRYAKLREWDYLTGPYVRKTDLLRLQIQLRKAAGGRKPAAYIFSAISLVAEALKIEHALVLLETQGVSPLLEYFKRMREAAEKGKTKAVKRVMHDARMEAAFLKTYDLVGRRVEHPKLAELQKIVEKKLNENDGTKIIVFTHYRDSVKQVLNTLRAVKGCKPVGFVGQAGDGGLDQRTQVAILQKFRELHYNVLVCTSVGEEGLDVPAVDTVVFYEPVPSEIRSIQRRGRTGRQKAGEVVILMARDTRDEGIFWSAQHKEKKMKALLKNMQGRSVQTSLTELF
ncbi:MAG: DEAD/DEAH box helicase [Candidatus Aenigmatarchaeota archaeon]|nr:MAG: DEAD/DEAH box helicase [Candidatus Aenigmarchaeota archaeon]